METGQGDALDKALLGLHADLVARLADQGQLDAERFTSVMAQFRRVLELLPPGGANRAEIVVYLQTVIEWLGTDPWAHDRFGGPVLTLAAIERKLRVTATGVDLDADALLKQSRGQVILGGPGSGKTWVAKRAARRCAQDALAALTAGGALDEVELPLYTTCSSLYSAAGNIREAAVSSALERLSDLGGSRISAALRVFFTERNAPTLLVIDALDEARGGGLRLRQVGSLRGGSFSPVGQALGTINSSSMSKAAPLKFASSCRYATPTMSNPSSSNGSPSGPSGAEILRPRSHGGRACSRPLPCR